MFKVLAVTFLVTAQNLFGAQTVPVDFKLKERMWITTSFDVYNSESGKKFGYIDSELIGITAKFDFKTKEGKRIAKGYSHFFEWGMKMDVYDENKALIGRIEQEHEFFNIPLGQFILINPGAVAALIPLYLFSDQYTIYNGEDQKVANVKTDSWFITMRIEDYTTGKKVMEVKRPWYAPIFYSTWKSKVYRPEMISEGNVDPRLVIMTAAIRAYKEKLWRAPFRSLNDNPVNAALKDEAERLLVQLASYDKESCEEVSDEEFEEFLALTEGLYTVADEQPVRSTHQDEKALEIDDLSNRIDIERKICFVSRLQQSIALLDDPDVESDTKRAVYHVTKRFVDVFYPF